MAAGNQLIDFSTFHSRLRVRGVLHAETALRIGSGGGGGPTEHDLPVLKDLHGQPYVPGSSFKGAYRAHLERLLRGMDETLACPSTSRPRQAGQLRGCLTQGDVDRLKQDPLYREDAPRLSHEIMRRSCWICSLLGAPWLASKVLVRDLTVRRDTWFDHYLIRDGVAIDRDTETAAEGLKYDFEAVPSGTEFDFEMVIENASDAELGLALLGLREFESGYVPLGGASSRGLGKVRLELCWNDSEWIIASNLRNYLEKKVTGNLAKEEDRERYWQAFLTALQNEKEGKSDA
jgi:CRISPR-associated RAMP protein (TIGR02581 family)